MIRGRNGPGFFSIKKFEGIHAGHPERCSHPRFISIWGVFSCDQKLAAVQSGKSRLFLAVSQELLQGRQQNFRRLDHCVHSGRNFSGVPFVQEQNRKLSVNAPQCLWG
jgi:hypothetical protein